MLSVTVSFFQDKPWYSQTNWGLQMNIPVFSSGKGRAVVKQSEIQLLQDEYNFEMTRQGLKLQEVQLKNTIASALKKKELQKENHALAERIYRNAINKEKLGNGNNLLVTQKLNQTMMCKYSLAATSYHLQRATPRYLPLLECFRLPFSRLKFAMPMRHLSSFAFVF